jgi:uncharacterized SAM-binding protein YcdF (DUF218 family)
MMGRVLAGILTNPLLLAALLAALGLALRGSRRRAGSWCIASAAGIAYLASTSLVGNALLAPLERRYPAFDAAATSSGVRDIVVLGSSYMPHDQIPATGALDAAGLARIVEGVRLARARRDSRLIVSGGAPPGFAPSAVGYAQLAEQLGVDRSALVVMDRALDTRQEARAVAAMLGHSPFIMVTSAYHMPRAMRLMQLEGANPLAAPTGQLSHTGKGAERWGLIPGSRGLHKTEAALHEYLGLAAISLRMD